MGQTSALQEAQVLRGTAGQDAYPPTSSHADAYPTKSPVSQSPAGVSIQTAGPAWAIFLSKENLKLKVAPLRTTLITCLLSVPHELT